MATNMGKSVTVEKRVAVLLMKTKASQGDAYEDHFSTRRDGYSFDPRFVPVLEHGFEQPGMEQVAELLHAGKVNNRGGTYGGLIFTSQRAAEALNKIIADGRSAEDDEAWPHLSDVPVYSVGPATTRALRVAPQRPPLQIFGEHTGSGDKLARFIQEHYGQWYRDRLAKPRLLFLVGEQRRDVIPKTLTDESLEGDKRIPVDEMVVYRTRVNESLGYDLQQALKSTADYAMRWIVIFSPSGCDGVLPGLGLLEETTGKAKPKIDGRTTFVATIGPTTRSYLQTRFGYEPDVCSEHPTPERLWAGITEFMAQES